MLSECLSDWDSLLLPPLLILREWGMSRFVDSIIACAENRDRVWTRLTVRESDRFRHRERAEQCIIPVQLTYSRLC